MNNKVFSVAVGAIKVKKSVLLENYLTGETKKLHFFSFLNQICRKTNFLGAGDKDGKKFGCCLFICLRYKLIQCHTIQYDTAWLDNILSSVFFLLAGLFIFWFRNYDKCTLLTRYHYQFCIILCSLVNALMGYEPTNRRLHTESTSFIRAESYI